MAEGVQPAVRIQMDTDKIATIWLDQPTNAKNTVTAAMLSELAEAVDSLERDGFVRRSEDRNDRRVVVVEITARGRREIDRVGELMRAPVAKILARVTPPPSRRLARIARPRTAASRKAPGGPGCGPFAMDTLSARQTAAA